MQEKKQIQDKVALALDSLNGLQRARPALHFYTRLHASMQRVHNNVWDRLVMVLSKPAIAMTVIVFVIAVNTMAVLQENETVLVSDQAEMTVADEYNMDSHAYIDYVNQEP